MSQVRLVRSGTYFGHPSAARHRTARTDRQLCGYSSRNVNFAFGSGAPVRSLDQQTYGRPFMPAGIAGP